MRPMTTTASQAEESRPGDSRVATAGDVYRLGHRWQIDGPIDVVFDVLSRPREFTVWWAPCFKSAQSDSTELVVGSSAHFRVRSKLPYELVWDVTLVQSDRPAFIELDTVVRLSNRFPLRGPIRYTLTEAADGVTVVNEQVIVSERRLPRPVRALLQRAFAYNHAWAFRIGGRGLQKAVDEILPRAPLVLPPLPLRPE